jgi:hypothetical protein
LARIEGLHVWGDWKANGTSEMASDKRKSEPLGLAPRRESSNVCVYGEGYQLAMKRMVSDVKSEKLAQELRDLEARSDDELKDRWCSLYGTKPPQKIHRSLLIAAVAHRIQEIALGALKPSVHRHLMEAANDTATSRPSPGHLSLRPRAGTLLVREWGGVTHQAKVLEDGILFRSKRYRSLSEVARVITGSRWSGPLFFGLKIRPKEQNHGTR